MATGYLQGKYEQTGASNYTPNPGSENTTPTLSGKVMYFPLQSATPNLNSNPLERDDELRNYDQPILRVTDTFDPTWDYTSRAYPDLLGWHLAQLLGRDTTSGYAVTAGAAAAATTTTTAASTTTTVAITSGTGTANGQYVTGTGVPANTTIASGGGTTSLTLSQAVNVASGATLSFGGAVDISGTSLLLSGQYAHTWTAPFGPAGGVPQTSQMIFAYRDQSTFYQMNGCATEQLELDTPDSGGVALKAQGPSLYLNSITDPSQTPAYETVARRPFVHGSLAVTYADTGSGYTTANAGVAAGFTVQARQPVNAIRTLGASSQYPDRMEKDDMPVMFSGTIAKRNLTKADWDAMKALSTFKLTASWVSTDYLSGTSGSRYGCSMTFPNAQLVGGSIDPLDNKRRHGASYNWNAVYDGTSASVVVRLVNTTTTYAV
jgi:hypothetical protein